MKRYRTLAAMMRAMQDGEIPANVVSPGGAANALGITRQAVHSRINNGTLRAWGAEGYILIDARELRAAVLRKRGIPATQGELNVSTA
jgi:hypothetical protein